jgi:hypothetical protein
LKTVRHLNAPLRDERISSLSAAAVSRESNVNWCARQQRGGP